MSFAVASGSSEMEGMNKMIGFFFTFHQTNKPHFWELVLHVEALTISKCFISQEYSKILQAAEQHSIAINSCCSVYTQFTHICTRF